MYRQRGVVVKTHRRTARRSVVAAQGKTRACYKRISAREITLTLINHGDFTGHADVSAARQFDFEILRRTVRSVQDEILSLFTNIKRRQSIVQTEPILRRRSGNRILTGDVLGKLNVYRLTQDVPILVRNRH